MMGGAAIDIAPQFAVGDPPPPGKHNYLAWHEWARVQYRGGLRQLRCHICNRWNFPQERCSHKQEHTK